MAGTDAGYCARKGKQLNLTLSPGCDANFLLTAKTTRRGVKGTFIDNQKLIFGIDDANDVSTSVINQFQGEPDCMNVFDNEDGSRVAVVSGPYTGCTSDAIITNFDNATDATTCDTFLEQWPTFAVVAKISTDGTNQYYLSFFGEGDEEYCGGGECDCNSIPVEEDFFDDHEKGNVLIGNCDDE